MIVVDTTVLVYAKGETHPLRDPSRDIIAAVAEGGIEATTTPEVIQEFAHVRARRRGRDDAVARANDYRELLSPLLLVNEKDLALGLALFASSSRLGAFDAVLAAAAAGADAEALVSADGAFAGVPGVRHVAPDAAGLAALLAL